MLAFAEREAEKAGLAAAGRDERPPSEASHSPDKRLRVDHGVEPGFGAPCPLFKCMRESKGVGFAVEELKADVLPPHTTTGCSCPCGTRPLAS